MYNQQCMKTVVEISNEVLIIVAIVAFKKLAFTFSWCVNGLNFTITQILTDSQNGCTSACWNEPQPKHYPSVSNAFVMFQNPCGVQTKDIPHICLNVTYAARDTTQRDSWRGRTRGDLLIPDSKIIKVFLRMLFKWKDIICVKLKSLKYHFIYIMWLSLWHNIGLWCANIKNDVHNDSDAYLNFNEREFLVCFDA